MEALHTPLLSEGSSEEGEVVRRYGSVGTDVEQGLGHQESATSSDKRSECEDQEVQCQPNAGPLVLAYMEDIWSLILFFTTIVADCFLLKSLYRCHMIDLATASTVLVAVPHVLMSVLLVVRQGWLYAAGQSCGFIAALNPLDSINPIPNGLCGVLAVLVAYVVYMIVAASGVLFVLYCILCYLIIALIFSLIILDLAMLVISIAPIKKIFKYTDLVYIENFKFTRLVVQCMVESVPQLVVIGLLLWRCWCSHQWPPGMSLVAVVAATTLNLLNVVDKGIMMARAVQVAGSGILWHLVYVLSMKGAWKVSRAVLEQNMDRLLRSETTLHFSCHDEGDDDDDNAPSVVPEYLTPSNGGALAPGQTMQVVEVAFKTYAGASVTDLILEMSLEVRMGKVLADVHYYFPNLTRVRLEGILLRGPDAVSMCKGLQPCPGLYRLHLVNSVIAASGARALVELLHAAPQLKEVAINKSKIADKGCSVLSEVLSTTSTLTHLDLANNDLSPANTACFIKALVNNQNVVFLNLAFNNLDELCVELLTQALQRSQSPLQHVLVAFDSVLTAAGRRELVRGVQKQRMLREELKSQVTSEIRPACTGSSDDERSSPPEAGSLGRAQEEEEEVEGEEEAHLIPKHGPHATFMGAWRKLSHEASVKWSSKAQMALSKGGQLLQNEPVEMSAMPWVEHRDQQGGDNTLPCWFIGVECHLHVGLVVVEGLEEVQFLSVSDRDTMLNDVGLVASTYAIHERNRLRGRDGQSGRQMSPLLQQYSQPEVQPEDGGQCQIQGTSPQSSRPSYVPPLFGQTMESKVLTTLTFIIEQDKLVDTMVSMPETIPGLVVLDLSGLEIGDEGAKKVAESLAEAKSLKGLNLSDNGIGDEGMKALSSALVNQPEPALEVLDIGENDLSEQGGIAVADLVNGCASLKDVRMVNNLFPFTLETLKLIQEACRAHPQVQVELLEDQDVVEHKTDAAKVSKGALGIEVEQTALASASNGQDMGPGTSNVMDPGRGGGEPQGDFPGGAISGDLTTESRASGEEVARPSGDHEAESQTDTAGSPDKEAMNTNKDAAARVNSISSTSPGGVATSSSGENVCGICFDSTPYVAIRTCGHPICVNCYREVCLLKPNNPLCPFCRSYIQGYRYLNWPIASDMG